MNQINQESINSFIVQFNSTTIKNLHKYQVQKQNEWIYGDLILQAVHNALVYKKYTYVILNTFYAFHFILLIWSKSYRESINQQEI